MAAEELEGRGYGSGYGRCVRPCDGLRKARQVWVPARSGCKGGMVEDIHLRGSVNFSMLGIFVSSRQALKTLSRQNHRSISSRTESQCARGRSSISTISPILPAAGSKEVRHIIIIALEQWLETIQQQKKQAKKIFHVLSIHTQVNCSPYRHSNHIPIQTILQTRRSRTKYTSTHTQTIRIPPTPYNRSHVH